MLPPDSSRMRRIDAGAAHVVFGNDISRQRPRDLRQFSQPSRLNGAPLVAFQNRVLGQVEIRDRAGLVPVFGDAGDAALHGAARRPLRHPVAVQYQMPRRGRPHRRRPDRPAPPGRCRTRPQGRRSDRRATSRLTDFSPGALPTSGVLTSRSSNSASPGVPGAMSGGVASAPIIIAASAAGVSISGVDPANQLAMAQHHDAVGNRHDLVQLVRDEDHRQPVAQSPVATWRTDRRSPAGSAPRSVHRGSGSARRGTAP